VANPGFEPEKEPTFRKCLSTDGTPPGKRLVPFLVRRRGAYPLLPQRADVIVIARSVPESEKANKFFIQLKNNTFIFHMVYWHCGSDDYFLSLNIGFYLVG